MTTPPDPESPVVGRTWPDVIAELGGQLLLLLGKSTIYILIAGLLGVGYYFLQDLNAQREEDYKTGLRKLGEERDQAFALLQQFNVTTANVSHTQVESVASAFQTMKLISEEIHRIRQVEYESRLRLRDNEIEIERIESRAEELEADLAQKAMVLSEKEQELADSQLEIQRKGEDLTRRAGNIGELRERLGAFVEAAEVLRESEEQRLRELRDQFLEAVDVDPIEAATLSELARAIVADAASQASVNYRTRHGEARDIIVLPGELLSPFVNFSKPSPGQEYFDSLVGLSLNRMREAINAESGLGFQSWSVLRESTSHRTGLSERALVGLALNQGRFRLVALLVSPDENLVERISEVALVEGLFPIYGRSPEEIWENRAVFFIKDQYRPTRYERSLVDVRMFGTPGADESGVTGVPLIDLEEDLSLDELIYPSQEGAALMYPEIPLLTTEQLVELEKSNTADPWLRDALVDVEEGPRALLAFQARVRNSEAIAESAAHRVDDASLGEAVEQVVLYAITGDGSFSESALGAKFYNKQRLQSVGRIVLSESFQLRSDVHLRTQSEKRSEEQDGTNRKEGDEWTQEAVVTFWNRTETESLTFHLAGGGTRWVLVM